MPTDFQKAKRRVKLANGNWSKPISYLTSSESVEMTDGSNLQTTINNKVDKVTGKDLSTNDYTDADKIAVSSLGTASTKDVGTANGVAELDSNGKVPSSQLPSYVNDVIEGYYNSSTDRFYKESTFTTVIPPEDGKSWVDIASNKSYRWTGSVYTRVDEGVQLGETSSTAYRGDRGKTAYDHSQTTGNPHGTTKSDIGLGNVDNTADLEKPISTATQTELDKKETIQSSSINMQKNYQYTGHYGVKNLIELTVEKIKELNGGESTWNGNSKTISGLTYTIITDENNNVSGIMASGTYTGTNDYCRLVVFKDFEAHSNLYTINNYDGNIELEIISTNGTIYYSEGVVQQRQSINIGNSDLYFNGELRIPKNITVSDLIAKPMIRPYVVTSPTFEPYAKSNQQLTHDLSTSLTATGNPLTIESSESNLVECVATISSSTSSVIITVKDKSTNPTVANTYTIDLGRTVPSGTLDVVKGTLTTGGTTYNLPPTQIKLLKGNNVISSNVSSLSIKYYPDNVLGQLKGDIESEYDERIERIEQYTDVFGFIEDMDVLSPTERIKYIGKNENYEPLTVDLNTGSYTLGDWGDFPFLVDNKPYMVKPDGTPDYQLNEYDYTKKLDGTASDVANENYDGGGFSWGRKIYKKQWMVGNKRHVLYSFNKKDGFHADGFIDKDGKELDGRWIPMFYGTVVNGKAKSIASGNCITGGNLTTDAQHNAIVAFDSNANFFGGAFVETLIDLLMMFAKNSDLQAAYGYGNSSGYVNDSSKNYGMLNNAVVGGGQFYGRSGGKTLNKALHSIVLATYNSYMRDPYEVIKNGKVVVSEDYTYDPTGATYTDTGITVPDQSANAWRYPKKYIAVPRYGSIPDISVGGASTSLGRADGTYTLANQSGSVIVCLRLCYCDYGASAGLSCRVWNAAASDSWWNVGFALLLDGSAVA